MIKRNLSTLIAIAALLFVFGIGIATKAQLNKMNDEIDVLVLKVEESIVSDLGSKPSISIEKESTKTFVKKGVDGTAGTDGGDGKDGSDGGDGNDGADGNDGQQGDKGDKGDAGAQGEKGDVGDTGPQGEKGDTGSQGSTGISGFQTIAGDTLLQSGRGKIAPYVTCPAGKKMVNLTCYAHATSGSNNSYYLVREQILYDYPVNGESVDQGMCTFEHASDTGTLNTTATATCVYVAD